MRVRGFWDQAASIVNARFLLLQLARRSFRSRYSGSLFGWSWSLVSAGVQYVVLWVVFSKVIGMRIAEPRGVGFGAYLMSGLVPYLGFSEVVGRATVLFKENAVLIQRMRFPLGVMVVGDGVGVLGHNLLALVAVVLICGWRGLLDLGFVSLLICVGGLVVLWVMALAAALWLAPIAAYLPDTSQVVALLMQVLFYATPIVYPLSLVPEGVLRRLVELNPLSVVVAMFRGVLIGAEPPSVVHMVVVGLAAVVFFGGGLLFLGSLERKIADLV